MSDYAYCIATHPQQVNLSLNSRGRKYHLTTDKKLSLCKNIVTGVIDGLDKVYGSNGQRKNPEAHWSPTQYKQGLCGNCRTIANQQGIKFKEMGY